MAQFKRGALPHILGYVHALHCNFEVKPAPLFGDAPAAPPPLPPPQLSPIATLATRFKFQYYMSPEAEAEGVGVTPGIQVARVRV